MSSPYHPETDGQSENTNKEMEQYVRLFCNYAQDDWSDWLPLAEFVANNSVSETTGVSPFMANRGINPRFGDIDVDLPTPLLPHKQRLDAANATTFANKMKELVIHLREQMRLAQGQQADNANKNRSPAPLYAVGDKVYVSTANWSTNRPTHKFEHRWAGPYEITHVRPGNAYRLALPPNIAVENLFHSKYLRPAFDPIPGQTAEPPPLQVEMQHDEETVYAVEAVIDSKTTLPRGRTPRGGKTPSYHYLVKWRGYREPTWEPATLVVNGAAESVADFHHHHPNKPKPDDFTPPPDWIPFEEVGGFRGT